MRGRPSKRMGSLTRCCARTMRRRRGLILAERGMSSVLPSPMLASHSHSSPSQPARAAEPATLHSPFDPTPSPIGRTDGRTDADGRVPPSSPRPPPSDQLLARSLVRRPRTAPAAAAAPPHRRLRLPFLLLSLAAARLGLLCSDCSVVHRDVPRPCQPLGHVRTGCCCLQPKEAVANRGRATNFFARKG